MEVHVTTNDSFRSSVMQISRDLPHLPLCTGGGQDSYDEENLPSIVVKFARGAD